MCTHKITRFGSLLLFSFFSATCFGQGITVPRVASPAAEVTQKIGISTVTVNYSRPAVKKREVWGGLVPYGWNVQPFGSGNSAPWRAGANENTTITFSHNAMVEGKPVPAGTYGLFFVINKDNTGEVILSKDYRAWGSFFYEQKQDLLRSNIKLASVPFTELLTFDFTSLTKNGANLVLNWEQKQFPVKLEFAVDDIVMANAMDELKGPTGFNWQGPASAANYASQNNVQLEQGVKWIDQSLAQNRNFGNLSIRSVLLKKMGRTAEADKVMEEAINISNENELNLYGYQLMTGGDLPGAIKIFQLNTKRFPRSANVWDSLGEGFYTAGDKKNAIASFKKSMDMNPPANVKANSEKFLKQLDAL